jgi:dynactin 1
LPDKYHETEADPTTLFLFFKRISSKVDTLINTVSSLHGLPSSLQSASAEPLVGICELRGKLRHFSTLNKRFGGIMSRCSPDDWVSYGKTLVEVGGVENKVDGWINGIRNEAFNEGDCVRELGSLIAQFDHLCATVFDRPELDVGEQQLGFAYAFEYDLDNFAAAVGYARQAIVGLIKDDGTWRLRDPIFRTGLTKRHRSGCGRVQS